MNPPIPRQAPFIETFTQTLLLAAALFLTVLYILLFDNPPYPAVVPIAIWFFIFCKATVLWLVRGVGRRPPSRWQFVIAMTLALFATAVVSLAGQVGEQEREFHRKDRTITE